MTKENVCNARVDSGKCEGVDGAREARHVTCEYKPGRPREAGGHRAIERGRWLWQRRHSCSAVSRLNVDAGRRGSKMVIIGKRELVSRSCDYPIPRVTRKFLRLYAHPAPFRGRAYPSQADDCDKVSAPRLRSLSFHVPRLRTRTRPRNSCL